MIKLILVLLVSITALLGLCEIIHSIWTFFVSPKSLPKTVSLVFINNLEDAEISLHYAGSLFSWGKRGERDMKIAVFSDELTDRCSAIAESYDMLPLKSAELSKIINSFSKTG